MAGESDLIDWIRSQETPNPLVQVGVGDDLAVLKWPDADLLLIGVDQVLDDVHFESTIHSPEAIGKKAMNRNLSDCAAMACRPAAAVVTLALPTGSGVDYARQIFLGMKQAGDFFNCPIVGGDTSSWSGKLVVTVTILGRSDGVTPITRGGAKAGDIVYVTGPLGGSRLGRHMTFEPRVELARELATQHTIHAMADLSDGLQRDLKNICIASGVGACIDTLAVPIHDDVSMDAPAAARAVHAMTDGEDYELLVVSPDVLPSPCIEVGTIVSEPGYTLITEAGVSPHRSWRRIGGWEHSL
jgi:thiamine-monophosphate kinase